MSPISYVCKEWRSVVQNYNLTPKRLTFKHMVEIRLLQYLEEIPDVDYYTDEFSKREHYYFMKSLSSFTIQLVKEQVISRKTLKLIFDALNVNSGSMTKDEINFLVVLMRNAMTSLQSPYYLPVILDVLHTMELNLKSGNCSDDIKTNFSMIISKYSIV
eukprot:TRINITY_DN7373_c0_g1_i1.p1 TRINITY_DN7373_c0_g1~~TRINITY_DN7373_c0_g1_i1.p1  ORF type:complete len:159 (-),score=24.03 TRINITY_DN7373_c0_g1_i1:47-523(-)